MCSSAGQVSIVGIPVVATNSIIGKLLDAFVDFDLVVDVEPAKMAIRGGSKAQWRAGIKKFYWEPDSSAGC